MDFLENCLSPEFLRNKEARTIEKQLVQYIFGPILLRSRFTHIMNQIAEGDVVEKFDFETMTWVDTSKICILDENWYVVEESEQVRDADKSYACKSDSELSFEFQGLTKGEQRFKFYSQFSTSDEFWRGPYVKRGLDIFIEWYQKARKVVEDDEAKIFDGVPLNDKLKSMAGKLSDQAASDAVLIHALCAQLMTEKGGKFLSDT